MKLESELSLLRKKVAKLEASEKRHKETECRINLMQAVSQAIRESGNLEKALKAVLSHVCMMTGWDYGEVWMPNEDGTHLRFGCSFFNKDRTLAGFARYSRGIVFPAGTGLPGNILLKRKPLWVEDLSCLSEAYPRAAAARKYKIKAAFGVPIVLGIGKVFAVTVFAMKKIGKENRALVRMVTEVVSHLAPVFKHREAEEKIRLSREQLRSLSAYFQTTLENERKFIASEVHDELGQTLTALKMDISWIKEKLPDNEKKLISKADETLSLVDDCIKTVQKISHRLRPGLVDSIGFVAAAEWYLREYQSRSGINCEYIADIEEGILNQDFSDALYRIFQEALTNVSRHAGASKVQVKLVRKNGNIALEVRDNGRGITKKQIESPSAIGIVGMMERAEYLGGRCEISGISGAGTTVKVTMPIAKVS